MEPSGSIWLFGLGAEFWSAVIGAIVGSLGSGVASFLLQKQSFYESQKLLNRSKLEIDTANAYSIIIKLIRMQGIIISIKAHIDGARLRRQEDKNMEWWQVTLPLANTSTFDPFRDSELALAAGLAKKDLLNGMINIDLICNSYASGLRAYEKIRERISDAMTHQDFNADVGISALSKEQYMKIKPRMIEANDLISEIDKTIDGDAKQIEVLLMDAFNSFKEMGVLPKEFGIAQKECKKG